MNSKANQVWNIKLSDGTSIPILGLGTYKSPSEDLIKIVTRALEIGYRHFDSADYYKNLDALGTVLNKAIAEGQVTRDQLYVTTKVWGTDLDGPGRLLTSAKRQLAESKLDYFDLVLIHWPMVFADKDERSLPLDESGNLRHGTRPLTEVYAELEQVQKLKEVLNSCTIRPVMMQLEKSCKTFCSDHGIALTAFAPIGRGNNTALAFNMLDDPVIKEVSAKYKKTPAQISLRYLLQRGISAIPKTVSLTRLEENFDVFDFELESGDMDKLLNLDCNRRLVWWPDTKSSPYYPFKDGVEF
ncbi:Alcohol dehydrogenase [NADP(+)] [Tyrophagus putrescentiae]|nr:Alcohol dehydrogenase [NADP(+)] [Tyrophagus putrescentiae]